MSKVQSTDGAALAVARAILIFACAEILDVETTIMGLAHNGFSEGNPLATSLFARSPELALVLKMLIPIAVMLAVVKWVSPRRQQRVLLVMAAIALFAPLVNSLQLFLAL